MASEVLDPALLSQLNTPNTAQPQAVTDPALLAQLNGQPTAPVQQKQVPPWLGQSMAPGQVSTAAPQTAPIAPPQDDKPLNWSDVPGQAWKNAPASAVQFGSDIMQAVMHPVETGTNIGHVGQGVLQKIGALSGDDHVAAANAVGEFFGNRYGSMEGFKKALATDPVGVASDLSAVLTGGGALAARAPGLAGKAGEIARVAGRAVDPLNVVTKPVGAAVTGASKVAGPLLSLPTGVGAGSLDAARVAGREGGASSEAVTSQMRRAAPVEEIVADAHTAADQMRQTAQDAYKQSKTALAKDKTIMPWADVDKAITNVDQAFKFKGRASGVVTDTIDAVKAKVNDWKQLHPADYHTPEGFDALKKELWGDVISKIPREASDARAAANKVYDAVKGTVAQHAPGYTEMLGSYQTFQNRLNEITRDLSLKDPNRVDAALRKLTSSVRNNVSTNFGRRDSLITQLQDAGAPQLKNKIVGSDLSTILPRGIVGRTLGGVAGLGAGIGGLASLATAALTAPFFSPRAMGETFHAVGGLQRLGDKYGKPSLAAARQVGRLDDIPKRIEITRDRYGR